MIRIFHIIDTRVIYEFVIFLSFLLKFVFKVSSCNLNKDNHKKILLAKSVVDGLLFCFAYFHNFDVGIRIGKNLCVWHVR